VYAAGGVRDTRDLQALRDIGAAGVLVASALHNGRIAMQDLERLAS
jgi:phosphoribosylformimino-5-aminoimidazole carboxamide ribotide isomerase